MPPFLHGCNYPWSTDGQTVFYGMDFGANVWGSHLGVSTRPEAVARDFAVLCVVMIVAGGAWITVLASLNAAAARMEKALASLGQDDRRAGWQQFHDTLIALRRPH